MIIRPRSLVALLVPTSIVALISVVTLCLQSQIALPRGRDVNTPSPVGPFVLKRTIPRDAVRETSDSVLRVSHVLWPRKNAPFGALIHGLHAFHGHAALRPVDGATEAEMLAVLTNGKDAHAWYGNANLILPTRYGAKFFTDSRMRAAAQSHLDQSLTLMAELGLALDSPIVASNGSKLKVAHFLDEAMAGFHADSEFDWTALSIILYCPTHYSWRNKFDEEFTYDGLVDLLIKRQLSAQSCVGAHIAYAEAALLQRNSAQRLLSDTKSKALEKALESSIRAVELSQSPNGAIRPDWRRFLQADLQDNNLLPNATASSHSNDTNQSDRERLEEHAFPPNILVLSTAHHLEWLFLIPAEMQPPPEVYSRAAAFLSRSLEIATNDDIISNFCAYSHAAHVLLLLEGRPPRHYVR